MFFGKNKVMQFALGREPAEEERTDLHILSKEIVGNNRGLIFTNRSQKDIAKVFQVYIFWEFSTTFLSHTFAPPQLNANNTFLRRFLQSLVEPTFARSGFIATDDFSLPQGEVPLPFSMETQLRKYGLPTRLRDGK